MEDVGLLWYADVYRYPVIWPIGQLPSVAVYRWGLSYHGLVYGHSAGYYGSVDVYEVRSSYISYIIRSDITGRPTIQKRRSPRTCIAHVPRDIMDLCRWNNRGIQSFRSRYMASGVRTFYLDEGCYYLVNQWQVHCLLVIIVLVITSPMACIHL